MLIEAWDFCFLKVFVSGGEIFRLIVMDMSLVVLSVTCELITFGYCIAVWITPFIFTLSDL